MRAPEDELAEIRELARTAGVEPVGELVQRRARPARRTYVGNGKVEEMKAAFTSVGAESLLVDDELDPTQQRFLENALDTRVDRSHAADPRHLRAARDECRGEAAGRARAARVQPSTHARHVAAPRATRGRRRHARAGRVAARERPADGAPTDLGASSPAEGLEQQRETRRKERRRTEVPTIALAGYTNVGKSTLLNALTGSDVSVENQLFHTLDPTTRGFEEDGRRYLVTDTVGFIRRLPHQLVEGFASTLEETLVADVVLHVVDAAASDDEQDRQREAVGDVLHEIGAGALPVEIVLNKIDRVDPLGRRRLGNHFPGAPQVSALTGEGLDELRATLARRFDDRWTACGCSFRTAPAVRSPSCTGSGRRSRNAPTPPKECS